jgi:hypothetical protein
MPVSSTVAIASSSAASENAVARSCSRASILASLQLSNVSWARLAFDTVASTSAAI